MVHFFHFHWTFLVGHNKNKMKIAIASNQIVLLTCNSNFRIPLEMGVTALMEIPPISLMTFVQLDVQSFLKYRTFS